MYKVITKLMGTSFSVAWSASKKNQNQSDVLAYTFNNHTLIQNKWGKRDSGRERKA